MAMEDVSEVRFKVFHGIRSYQSRILLKSRFPIGCVLQKSACLKQRESITRTANRGRTLNEFSSRNWFHLIYYSPNACKKYFNSYNSIIKNFITRLLLIGIWNPGQYHLKFNWNWQPKAAVSAYCFIMDVGWKKTGKSSWMIGYK